jgi:hypothetical protein
MIWLKAVVAKYLLFTALKGKGRRKAQRRNENEEQISVGNVGRTLWDSIGKGRGGGWE